MSNHITAIARAHDMAAQVDVQALHGGLPANHTTTYQAALVNRDMLDDITSHLCRMGYTVTREEQGFELFFTVTRRAPK